MLVSFVLLVKMDRIINLDIPHIGELIFESINTKGLVKCLSVSKTWKVLVETVLLNRHKGQLFEACVREPSQVVKILLERSEKDISELNQLNLCSNVRFANKDYFTPFMLACRNGRKDVVKLLLEYSDSKSIDINAKTKAGYTAFMEACLQGRCGVVKILLEHCGNQTLKFNAKNGRGETAFMIACKRGRNDVVKLLLSYCNRKRIELNSANSNGLTAFMYACGYERKTIVKLLLKHQGLQRVDFNATRANE